jgi:hypothetical protein
VNHDGNLATLRVRDGLGHCGREIQVLNSLHLDVDPRNPDHIRVTIRTAELLSTPHLHAEDTLNLPASLSLTRGTLLSAVTGHAITPCV